MKKGRWIVSLLLALSLLAAQTAWGAQTPQTLEIADAAELAAFSRRCVTDSYSVGLRVELTADIDLAGSDFEPIPIFSGTFNGNGHTVSGFSYTGGGYVRGLFRYLTESAQVRDLTLETEMAPGADKTVIGGLCGENSGLIQGCAVSGSVSGEEDVGGIVGVNTAAGRIVDCRSLAAVTGTLRTGGIAGDNAGTLRGCKNRGAVNGTPNDLADAAGGIAGRSTGRIVSCENGGAVGYYRTGYNVGGVAGIQNGDVENCTNLGEIRGRKDVGGVVGQSEPAVNTEYVNKLTQLDAALASLPEQVTALNGYLGSAADDILDIVDETAASLSAASSQLNAGIARLNENLSAAVDATEADLKSASTHLGYASDDLDAALRELEDASTAVQRAVTDFSLTVTPDILFTAEDVQRLIESIRNDPTSTDSLEQLIALLEKWNMTATLGGNASAALSDAIADVRDALEALRRASAALHTGAGYLGGAAEDLLEGISGATQDLSDTINQVDAVLTAYAARIQSLTDSAKATADQIETCLNGIVATLDTVRGVLSDITAGPNNTREDISDLRESGLGGAVMGCRNYGGVEADYNVGGIVGNASRELGTDPEQDLDLDLEAYAFSDSRSVYRLAIQGCRNEGSVSAKYTHAGGVVGRGREGTILDCRNYGDVRSEGALCGGIVGEYAGKIKDCRALGSLSASGQAGGIAGQCVDMSGCYSMVVIESGGGKLGSLAGIATGELADNYFVSDSLGGVDGINYDGRAMPISYAALMETEGVADTFRYLTVRFSVEGDIIWTDKTPYGGSIAELPQVPDRDGQYWVWEDFPRENIICSRTVEGEYVSPRGAVSTGGELPEALAEGSFYPGQALRLEEIPAPVLDTPVLRAGRATVGGAYDGALTLRLRCAEEGLLYVAADGGWVRRDYVRDGSYLVFALENGGSFALAESPPAYGLYIALAGGAVLLAAVGLTLGVRRRRRRGKREKGGRAHAEQ